MSLASKILVFLVFLALAPMFFFSAKLFSTYQSYGEAYNKHIRTKTQLEVDQKNIKNKHFEKEELQAWLNQGLFQRDDQGPAPAPGPGIRQLDETIEHVLAGRGRVWRFVNRAGLPDATGAVRLAVPQDQQARFPAGLEANVVVYAFAEPNPQQPKASAYLGAFRVKALDPRGATLEPVNPLNEQEMKRIAGSSLWTLYELLPGDDHLVFAGMNAQQLTQGFGISPDVVETYVRDGKPPALGDSPENVRVKIRFLKDHIEGNAEFKQDQLLWVDGVTAQQWIQTKIAAQADAASGEVNPHYARPLQDYEYVIGDMKLRRTEALLEVQQSRIDLQHATAALADSKIEGEFHQRQIGDLGFDFNNLKREVNIVKEQVTHLQKHIQSLQSEINKAEQANANLASQLALLQLEAVRRIEEKSKQVPVAGDDNTAQAAPLGTSPSLVR